VKSDVLPADTNPVVQKLKQDLGQVGSPILRGLSFAYKPGHETYKAAVAKINMLKEQIRTQGANYAPPSMNQITRLSWRSARKLFNQVSSSRARLAPSIQVWRAHSPRHRVCRTPTGLEELDPRVYAG